MIDRGRASSSLAVAAVLCASAARAGVWGVDPTVGVSGIYASDPVLLDTAHTSETDAALLFDSPITYQGNALTLSLVPSFRVTDTRSYSSLNSDYVHLTARGEFDADRNTLKISAGANRDSSLYQDYLIDGETAVRRDGLTGDIAYTRHLTQRLDADLEASTTHVRYGTSSGVASLTDYKYTAVAPDLSWQRSEHDNVTLSLNGGQYDALNGTTRSRNYGAQLAYNRSLSEIWSLNLSGGYTRQQNRIDLEIPEIAFIPGIGFVVIEVPVRVETQVDTPVYSARLTRSGERLTLNLSATRSETPTGFAFLSRQTTYDLQLGYALSERWSASLHESWQSSHNPGLQGQFVDQSGNSVTLSCTYQLSEHYTLGLALSRVDLRYSTLDLHIANNQVSLTLNYKFDHISLQ